MDRQRTNPFVEFLELLADLAILNVLFLLCCLPVVTAGASLAGLNYAAEKLRRQEGRPVANFFRGFRVNFRQATIFWIIFLCLIVFLFLDLYFLIQNGESGLYLLLLGLVLLWLIFTFIYFYPLLVRFDNKLLRHVRNAFLLSLTHLGRTICLTALALNRYTVRQTGEGIHTAADEFLDVHFPDERIEHRFQNLKLVD